LLSFYRRLIWFRRGSAALQVGSYAAVEGVPDGVFAFVREHDGERLLVVLNFLDTEMVATLPSDVRLSEVVIGTHGSRNETTVLTPCEGRLYRLA
jgi:glycosidase